MAKYTNILVAIDFSSSADEDEIAQRAMAIAENNATKLSIIHVVEYMPPFMMGNEPIPSTSWVINEDELVDNVKKKLGEFVRRLNIESADQVVSIGTAKREIIRIAKEKNADLIVVGSHGRHGVGLLLGSTANSVLHHSECDVLAVRVDKK
ncbi:MAG: universal stress protein [Gammaproteobacteria bacterium]|nr:universal stress protein [Gammaproteobacteria bacterium]